MIMNEVRALRRLDHPNIVKLREVFEQDEEVCIIMEHVAGKRMFDEIVRTKGIDERNVSVIMKQLFSVLAHCEYCDIIHRDLKPENILFTLDDNNQYNIKLIDFGLAAFHSKRDAIKRGGTAGYVAPEILRGEPYDFKADIYSAGVFMFTW